MADKNVREPVILGAARTPQGKLMGVLAPLSAAELLQRLRAAGFQPVFAQRISDAEIEAAGRTTVDDLQAAARRRRDDIETGLLGAGVAGAAGAAVAALSAIAAPPVVLAGIGLVAVTAGGLPLAGAVKAYAKSLAEYRLDEVREKVDALRRLQDRQEVDAINGEGRLRQALGADSSNESLLRWAEAHKHRPQEINAPEIIQAIVRRIDHQFGLDAIAAGPEDGAAVEQQREYFRKSTFRPV